MPIQKLLIANRGEIAIRISRAAAELNLLSVAVFAEDDAKSLHTRKADQAVALRGTGVNAYMDQEQILALAKSHGCDAIHPGYGFLSESEAFARQCQQQGILFIGPDADALRLFGDKTECRRFAESCGVPLLAGTDGVTSLEQAYRFFDGLGERAAVMVKAISGGGGRGMRPVLSRAELAPAYQRCASEAKAAFGCSDLYVEQLVSHARHIEIQILGDGHGGVVHLYERECSLQRRQQKVIEVAPSPSLSDSLREKLFAAAVSMAKRCNYRGLGTFEFLVDCDSEQFFFLETNPRVQVEHTVTESVLSIDLVAAQLQVASGASLDSLRLTQQQIGSPRGYAMQLRINMETLNDSGEVVPAGGTLTRFEMASGPGVRVDSFGYAGYTTSPYYDSLLAKLVIHSASADYGDVIRKAGRALRECHIEGVDTNIALLLQLLSSEDVAANRISTSYLDQQMLPLLAKMRQALHSPLYFDTVDGAPVHRLHLSNRQLDAPANCHALRAPMQGVVVDVLLGVGAEVGVGQPLAVIESMKMEHVLSAEYCGIVRRIDQRAGDSVQSQQVILYIEPVAGVGVETIITSVADLDTIRADLQALNERKALLADAARPDAIAKRHALGRRSARENINDLMDDASLLEYGSLAVAAQRARHSEAALEAATPADGLICGIGHINSAFFSDDAVTRCAVMCYDYTVLAGTQGYYNHHKSDRLLQVVKQQKLPLVWFCEGGGGRPGDVDFPHIIGLTTATFATLASLSGLVPLVGIVSGRCFAGNAALLGMHDVIIATRDSSVGMAGPAMIEGGGLGRVHPDLVGPMDVQTANGVVDILVDDDAAAVQAAKKYLSYFQGRTGDWQCADQRVLRQRIPENRMRSYDVRELIHDLFDTDSVLELRPSFGEGLVTALVRIEGRPMGLIANNSRHLGGAIDTAAADKAARFINLCNAFDIPMLSLLDTPGFMVGPDAEKTAQVRHFSRLFVAAANADIPMFTLCLRKGYGLGAQAMAFGHFHSPMSIASWPTGEFGPMGLEGAVQLGYRKELDAQQEQEDKQQLFDQLVAEAYQRGRATRAASILEIDDVIDPAETRQWLLRCVRCAKPAPQRDGKKVPFVDTW